MMDVPTFPVRVVLEILSAAWATLAELPEIVAASACGEPVKKRNEKANVKPSSNNCRAAVFGTTHPS
jgi:hypothetical protein